MTAKFRTLTAPSLSDRVFAIASPIHFAGLFAGLLVGVILSTADAQSPAPTGAPAVATPAATPDSSANTAGLCESVYIGGQEVLCLSHGIASFTAKHRAEAVTARLMKAVLDHQFEVDRIQIEERDTTTDIVADGIILFSATDADVVDKTISRSEFAKLASEKMSAAITEARIRRTPKALLLSAIYAVATTAVFVLLLFLISASSQRVANRVKNNNIRWIRSVRLQSFELITADRIVAVSLWVLRTARVVVSLTVVYFYVPLVFSFFPVTENLSPKIYGYIADPLIQIFRVTVDFIPNFFFILVITFVTKYLLEFVSFLFREIERGTIRFDGFYRDWAQPTYKLVRLGILAFALIMAFPYLPGSGSPAFQGISVFLGVLISLGSSSAISNMVAGVVITYMRPFKTGDRVKIADTMGDVIEKNLLVTRIKTIKNVEITIPNSMVLSSHIINYSSSLDDEGLILNTTVTIGYDAPWPQVHAALIAAAKKTNFVCKDPEPFVFQTALKDFNVAYEINATTKHPNDMALIYSELHKNIQDSFNEAGIEILSPSYASLRDGNTVTIPESYRSTSYRAPKFEVAVATE